VNLLVVFSHPRRESFCGAVLDAFVAGLGEAGHSVEIADLHGEGFDPRMTEADEPDRTIVGKRYSDEVMNEQRRIERNASLVFVFPVWWWSFPAMLKGWIDRVFSEGWAYNFEPGLSRGRLRDRPVQLIGVAGSRESTYRKYGYGEAMRTQIDIGILGYCGLSDVAVELYYDVEQSPENRTRYLAEARDIGRKFLSPDRQQRVPALGSERPA